MAIAPPDFAHRNLRNRSFRGQALQGADFSQSDLRGCDFTGAQLQNANFTQARLGYAPEPIVKGLAVILASGAIAFHAFSTMIFGSLGNTAEHPAYGYGVVLAGFLAAAGVAIAAMRDRRTDNRPILPGRKRYAPRISTDQLIPKVALALVNGALLGFFYVGTAMAQNSQAAIIGAVVFGGLGAIVSRFCPSPLWLTALLSVGSLATYGFAFLAGVNALHHLSVGHAFRGGMWLLMFGVYLWLTLRGVAQLCQVLGTSARTTFLGADVTGADFPRGLDSQKQARYGLHRPGPN